jgi:LemA protein
VNIDKKYIYIGIVIAVILMLGGCMVSKYNSAITLEEKINNTLSDVSVQEKRRIDLILNLVEVVEQASTYEQETLLLITEARSSAEAGNVEEALYNLGVVVERYPELKAVATYTELMNELSLTENLIANHRKTVNTYVQEYRKFIRKFPNSMFLNILGYDKIDYSYLQFADTEMPDNLFGGNQ